MLKLSKRYNKLYTANVFKLNKCALKIQHWYFRSKQSQQESKKDLPVEEVIERKAEVAEETKNKTKNVAKIEEEKRDVLEPILKEFKED